MEMLLAHVVVAGHFRNGVDKGQHLHGRVGHEPQDVFAGDAESLERDVVEHVRLHEPAHRLQVAVHLERNELVVRNVECLRKRQNLVRLRILAPVFYFVEIGNRKSRNFGKAL